MPIYEFVCHDCGAKFTDLRKIDQRDEPAECEQCKSVNTERIKFHATDHILKGIGWARDGYRNKVKDSK